MFRFAKPNGQSFDLDYNGPIHAFDGGNDLVAICPGTQILAYSIEDDNGVIHVSEDEWICDPKMYDEWEVVIKLSPIRAKLLQHALATAYNALVMCEMAVVLRKEHVQS